ncbi:Glycosyl transferase family 2 [Prevotella sp. khp1]|uniref:glycosyltransferase family 2 protein n=1 Tax=Prevotellaceae TaxID=171552 RepID=UPI00088C66CA|nr:MULTISPECIES: glycosyltransferase family 2 protein [Prevotellaceae]QVJ80406.1 glycosyltransferase family 2 protein [Xylanibacter ruminicola]SDQ22484.1 Glycosyl transferase family 2 [Prevotella sp. khp1]
MISVVIPLYNKETSIANTLNCVLAQTYQDFEIVVVDDGSTDNSAAIVDTFKDHRIRLIRQPNGGVSVARNTGIKEAKGEYVAFLDADDKWLNGHLENLAQLIKKYPNNRAYATTYYNELNGVKKNIVLNKIPFKTESGILNNYFEICSNSQPPVWSSAVCVERNLILSVGGFPVGIKAGEDLLTWARIAVRTDWAYSMKPTAIYMLGEGYDYSKKPARRQDDSNPVCEGLKELLMSDYTRKSELSHFIGRFYKMKASISLRFGDHGDTISNCLKSLWYRPFAFETYPILIMGCLPNCISKKILETHKC